MAATGLIIAAPSSGSGKTVVSAAIMRALVRRGRRVAPAKTGPDYIDAAFHAAACGRPCVNLDPWAMRACTLATLIARTALDSDIVICEGVMGLFDGVVADGRADAGSTADLAAESGWPVVLVVDARRQAASAAALVRGFASHRRDVAIAGVIFNRVRSDRHAAALTLAMAVLPDMPVLGLVRDHPSLGLPHRHLGLVQAREHPALALWFEAAAALAAAQIDLDHLLALAAPAGAAALGAPAVPAAVPVPGERIAVARDDAFAFAYDWLLDGWRATGADIQLFAPLADEAPAGDRDAVYLPGGYPELHAGKLAAASNFQGGLRAAAARGAFIWGECGGYMALGKAIVDADGVRHAMAGLLPLVTSFAERRLHLGYRQVSTTTATPLGGRRSRFRGHEFHYATTLSEGPGEALFHAANAAGEELDDAGLVVRDDGQCVAGSFIHLIDRVDEV